MVRGLWLENLELPRWRLQSPLGTLSASHYLSFIRRVLKKWSCSDCGLRAGVWGEPAVRRVEGWGPGLFSEKGAGTRRCPGLALPAPLRSLPCSREAVGAGGSPQRSRGWCRSGSRGCLAWAASGPAER